MKKTMDVDEGLSKLCDMVAEKDFQIASLKSDIQEYRYHDKSLIIGLQASEKRVVELEATIGEMVKMLKETKPCQTIQDESAYQRKSIDKAIQIGTKHDS